MGNSNHETALQLQELLVFISHVTDREQRLDLCGLENGYWNVKLIEHLAVLVSGLSIDTLQRLFYIYLEQSPSVKIIKRNKVHLRIVHYLMFDNSFRAENGKT